VHCFVLAGGTLDQPFILPTLMTITSYILGNSGVPENWASMSALSVCDVIDKYDVISGNSGVSADGQRRRRGWGLACTPTLSQYVTSLVNMTSFQATLYHRASGDGRSGWDGHRTGLACPLSQYDAIGKYDVISGNSGVPAGNDVAVAGLAYLLSQYDVIGVPVGGQ